MYSFQGSHLHTNLLASWVACTTPVRASHDPHCLIVARYQRGWSSLLKMSKTRSVSWPKRLAVRWCMLVPPLRGFHGWHSPSEFREWCSVRFRPLTWSQFSSLFCYFFRFSIECKSIENRLKHCSHFFHNVLSIICLRSSFHNFRVFDLLRSVWFWEILTVLLKWDASPATRSSESSSLTWGFGIILDLWHEAARWCLS